MRFLDRFLLAGAALACAGTAVAAAFPPVIALPDAFQPEGIAAGRGPVLYAGSLADGAIWAFDPRTGSGERLVAGQPGRVAAGLAFDRRSNVLFVAGATTGTATAIDAATGQVLATYALAMPGTSFINDAIVTRDAVYLTDSRNPVLYRLPLGEGGGLPAQGSVVALPLSGDWQQVPGFNANGIEATADGSALLVVHSTLGLLYRIDPATGVATAVDLGGASLSSGDGLLLEGHTLYVVRNRLNQVAVVELAPDLASGTVAATLADPDFDVPTTLARWGGALYAVNARFGTPPGPTTRYTAVRVDGR